jgi:hypothetical protein
MVWNLTSWQSADIVANRARRCASPRSDLGCGSDAMTRVAVGAGDSGRAAARTPRIDPQCLALLSRSPALRLSLRRKLTPLVRKHAFAGEGWVPSAEGQLSPDAMRK